MTKVEALKKLTIEITGKQIEEIKGTTISEVIVFLAENYNPSTSSSTIHVDGLSDASVIGKGSLKADDDEAVRTLIGAGTPYVLPNASTDTIGGVKKCTSVNFTTEGASAETCATAIQGIIQSLKTAGIMS